MPELLQLLAAPFVACLVLTGIHCYLGIHVLMREVIFVDLALAQIAALGAAAGVIMGVDPHSQQAYAFSLGFTFVGAAIFALGRFRDARVPQEAVIGIVYAVSSAAAIIVLSKSALEREHIEHMLVGRLLFVEWAEVGKTALIYGVIAVIHVLMRKPFFAVSRAGGQAQATVRCIRVWDFVFYATFGFVVTSSVQMAGVLLVFSFLIIPASCAMLFLTNIRGRLMAGWIFGLVGSAAGLSASAAWDLPTGAAVVAAFGVLFGASVLLKVLPFTYDQGR